VVNKRVASEEKTIYTTINFTRLSWPRKWAPYLQLLSSARGWLGVVIALKADLNWKLKISNNWLVRLDLGRSSLCKSQSACIWPLFVLKFRITVLEL